MDLLGRGRRADARRELAALLRARPRDPGAWICAAWIEHDARNAPAMREAVERAARFGARGSVLDLLRAVLANATGDMEHAVAHARRAAEGCTGGDRLLALAVLAESLAFAGRDAELGDLLAGEEALRNDPRGQLLAARLDRRRGDMAAAEAGFRAVLAGTGATRVRQMAGAELARVLDAAGRYDEAFAAAQAMHAATGQPFDTGGLIAEIDACVALAVRGAFRGMPRADGPIPPTALIAALPRTGTTLLEQMLDRHPGAHGIGESTAVHAVTQALISLGGWPQGALLAAPADRNRMRDLYLQIAREGGRLAPTVCTIDKSVQTWRRLPAVAAALPGAKVIRLVRDPRDTAISLFLSPMDPRTLGWSASLDDIRRVIAAERRSVPVLVDALGLDALRLEYEGLLREPRAHMERVLQFLGLPWHSECLAPEGSTRVAVTLSQEQVRRPLNADSVGRWRNYAAHFDARWEELAAEA